MVLTPFRCALCALQRRDGAPYLGPAKEKMFFLEKPGFLKYDFF
jgi:hypothetical protein